MRKADGIATASATKAFINFFCGRNRKGGCFFVMKRTETQIVGSSFFQFHKTADDFRDIYPAENLLNGIVVKSCDGLSLEFNLKKASLRSLNSVHGFPPFAISIVCELRLR